MKAGKMKVAQASVTRASRRLTGDQFANVAVVVVTLILFTVAWPTLHLTHAVSPPIQPFVAALAAFPFVLIRINPALGWAVSAISALVIPHVFDLVPGYEYPWQVVHIMVIMALLAAVSLTAAVPVVGVAWISTVLLFFAETPGQDGAGWAVGLTALVVFCFLIRWLVLSRRALAKQEEVNEVERARRTVLEEKARIARELHDIVAHHMSMVVVQAQSAPYRLGDVTPEIRAEFDSIGDTGRAALNEIRGLLGVLRSDAEATQVAPQPGALQLDELLAGSARAGIPLVWNVDGDRTRVSASTGLVVYRIVQESITNAVRHAPGSPIEVSVEFGQASTQVRVVNGPPAGGGVPTSSVAKSSDTAGGNGIRGMVERASAVGGMVDTQLLAGGGFEVRAVLPTVGA
ncbi:two-component sensor histidine kinase [Rhodococcus sp. AD45-ID]|nr:Nitrate/nitrite sensor protein narX [Rhodococcus sp. AD45]PSR39711.1 two-component sensor histidine kinase [Rhodococcus sp. AD45-ID]